MTIYVVFSTYPYDGCSEPEAAFDTVQKAEDYIASKEPDGYTEWEYVGLKMLKVE